MKATIGILVVVQNMAPRDGRQAGRHIDSRQIDRKAGRDWQISGHTN